MTDFSKAFNITMQNEGGYAFDPDDAGGETYKGVSRRYNPTWSGWSIIDSKKDRPDFPKILRSIVKLQESVKEFYKIRYWDPFLGDEIEDQSIAEELFDTAVNMGVTRASRFLQMALNYLNRNEEMFLDLVEDGIIGSKTLKALNTCLSKGINECEYILKVLNILQGAHYLDYMRESPIQEKYARGWFNRVEIRKKNKFYI